MVGRKKSRGGSSRVAPADLQEEVTEEVVTTPVAKKDLEPPLVLDPWTDEQETSLFKGIVRWKPVGMHKHFRMVAISQNLRNHGYTTPRDDHTRIPYIWEKIRHLYNLEALDDRENLMVEHNLEGRDKDPTLDAYCPFSLPHDEYGEMMFAKRLLPEGFISPESIKPTRSDESEDVEAQPDDVMIIDTDVTEPQPESPASPTPTPPTTPITAATPIAAAAAAAAADTPTPRSSNRGTRGTRGTRRSQLQSEHSRSLGRRGGRKASMDKAATDKASGDKTSPEGDKTENLDSGTPAIISKTKGRRGKRRGG